jgi:hypothetical protein
MANGINELKGVLKRSLKNNLVNDFFISDKVDYSPHFVLARGFCFIRVLELASRVLKILNL